MHNIRGDFFKTLVYDNPKKTVETTLEMVDEVIESDQFGFWSAQHSAIGAEPGAMVFGRYISFLFLF